MIRKSGVIEGFCHSVELVFIRLTIFSQIFDFEGLMEIHDICIILLVNFEFVVLLL